MKIYSEELKKIKLIDVFEIVLSGEWGEENLEDNENTAYIIRTTNFLNDGTLDVENRELVKRKISREKIDEKHLKRGDIIIEKSGGSPNQPVGRVVYFDIESEKNFLCNNFTSILRVKEGIEPKYIFYFLKDCYKKRIVLKYQNKTTGIINLKLQDYLKNTEIQLPNIEIQKKIVEILDKAFLINSLLIEKERRISELNKCLFIKMFKENYDKKNWENFSLEEIVEICSSKRVFLDQIVMEGIDFYRGTEIGLLSEGKKIEPKLFITKEHYENLIAETGKPKIGDLLLPSICNDGKIWYVNTEKPFYFKDGRVLWIKESDKVKGKFLQYFLRNEFLMNYKKIASGTTFSELKIFSLKKIKVKLPPIELQNQFAERVKLIEKSKFELFRGVA